MSLLEQIDKKSARQRTSFLVLLSETRMRRIHCSVCSMKRLYRKRTQVSAKSLFIFSNSTLHAELDETKHAFNFLALRIFENLITKASFFVFLQQIGSLKNSKGRPFAIFGTGTVSKLSLSVLNQVFFKHIHQKIFQHSIFQRYIRSI